MCYTDDEKAVRFHCSSPHFHCSSPHVAITPGTCTSQCPPPLNQVLVESILFILAFFFKGGGAIFLSPTGIKFEVTGRFFTKSFQYKSFRYKFIQLRCKQFHVLGLKNEGYSPQMCNLYSHWSKFSCNLSAWDRIKTTCMKMTLKRKKQIPNSECCSLLWYYCNISRVIEVLTGSSLSCCCVLAVLRWSMIDFKSWTICFNCPSMSFANLKLKIKEFRDVQSIPQTFIGDIMHVKWEFIQ